MTNPNTYTPSHVANFFLQHAENNEIPVSVMKLNKLVYFAYGWTLALLDRPLFNEQIEAWKYGPVIPSLYHEFKHFGSKPIEDGVRSYDFDAFKDEKPVAPELPQNEKEIIEILNKVWDLYKDFSATTLMRLTHEKGAPWDRVFKKNERNIAIDDTIIKEYFVEALTRLVSNDGHATG